MNLKRWIFTFFLLLFFLLPKVKYLNEPMMDWDEGIYQTAALYINSGYLPYRDFFDQKPPLIYYFFAACDRIYSSFISFRVAFFLVFFLSELFLFLILTHFFEFFYSLLGVFLFSLTTSSFWASSFNGEQLFFLPLLISIFLYLRGNEKKGDWNFFLSGFFAAVVFFIKYNAVVILLPLLLLEFDIRKVLKFLCGFFTFSISILFFIFKSGIFKEFWFDTVVYNGKYISISPLKILYEYGFKTIYVVFKDSFFTIVPAFIFLFMKGKIYGEKLIKGILIFSVISAILPLKFLNHYFYPLVSFSAVGTIFFLSKFFKSHREKAFIFAITFLISLFLIIPSLKSISNFSVKKIEKFYTPAVISRYVERESSKKDKIFVWRSHFLNTYYLSKRLPFVREFFWYLFLRKPMPKVFLKDFKNMLKENPPLFVVVGKSAVYGDRKFPFFENFLKSKYEKVFSCGGENVYRLSVRK